MHFEKNITQISKEKKTDEVKAVRTVKIIKRERKEFGNV